MLFFISFIQNIDSLDSMLWEKSNYCLVIRLHNFAYQNHILQASNTKQNAPKIIQDQSSTAAHCTITKKREFHSFQKVFALKNGFHNSYSKKYNFYSQTVTKFNNFQIN